LYTLYPFGRLNLKTAILVPMLMLSMFTFIPIVQSQVLPNISKITPAVFEQMSSAGESVNVIVQTLSSDYSAVVSQIEALGGEISHTFKYVNALSASVPKSQIVELSANSHVEKIFYDAPRYPTIDRGTSSDLFRNAPEIAEPNGVEAIELTSEMLESMAPENAWNSYAMGARPIWPATNYGVGSLVAIIDTGIWTGNIFFTYTSVVGGVDVSADVGNPAYEGWNKQTNYFHGGHVAGIIAANIALAVSPTSSVYRYVLAVERYAGITFPVVSGRKIMPVPGMAPGASLYIIKVFDHTGGATSTSYIMAGMEWAMDLKVNGTDIDVVNMSLGGADLFEGRDPEDQLVDMMTSTGITMCTSAGNEGPATMTGGARPGGANTAIASGAADNPVQTRAFYDYVYNYPGIGYDLYVSNNVQVDSMTSRGPTADGRVKPDVTATGVFVLSAYTASAGGLAWASGTSMSSPATAGAVALLNAWAEMNVVLASPEDYKQAIKGGAVLLPGWTQYDQGAGYLNAANSLAVLMADASYGDVATPLPSPPPLTDISNIPIVGSGTYKTSFSGLAPGFNKEFIFKALPTTNSIKVTISGVNLGVSPWGMNALTVHIESAKRTTNGYYVHYSYVLGNAWFLITDGTTQYKGAVVGGLGDYDAYTRLTKIEPGYVKVVIENDWMSYDLASATIEIKVTEEAPQTPDLSLSTTINDGQNIGWLAVPIVGSPKRATIELWWDHSWAMYPTNDLDLIVYWDDGYNYDGATINSPERVKLDNPTFIYLLISGFAVYSGTDNFTLKIYFEY
jgi:Subtilase family